MKILFICRGNVGRSQMAEAIFNNLSGGKHIAISTGTKVIREGSNMEGQKVKDKDMHIVEVMKEIGINVSESVRNQLTPEILAEADKAVVMAQPETIPEYLKQSDKAIFWEIPDPSGQSLEFARQVRNQLQTKISNFVETSLELKPNTDIKLH